MQTTTVTGTPIEHLSLSELWGTIYRRRLFVAAIVFVFLVLGLAYYLSSPKLYEARAVLLLENQQTDVQIKAVVTSEPNDLMLIPSEIQVLTSRDLMGKVIDKLGLVENPNLLSKHPEIKAEPVKLSDKEREDRRNALIDRGLGYLKVRQVERSRAIEVSFTGLNPKIAADVANTLSNLYIEQQLSANFDAVRITNEWLASRVAETQRKVFEADSKAAEYRAKAGIVDSRGVGLIEQNISDLSVKLTAANAAVAETEARLGAIGDGKNLDSAPEVLAAPLIQNLRAREAEARDNLAGLQNQLGREHPRVKTARAQVGEIRSKINDEIGKLAEGLRREHQTAIDNVANIQKQLDALKEDYNKYKSENVELAALEAEAETNRAFLDTLNLRFKETQSQQDAKFRAPYARIISPAPLPKGPSSPKGKLIMLASLLIGLGLGAGCALALDIVQHGVYNGKQIQRLTGRTNISVVPKVSLDAGSGLTSYADYPLHSPYSPYMQGIRDITMFMRLECDKAPGVKIFNFTSAAAGEGKSAVVVSVARQLALEGLKVLAVDCDVRQPTLTNTFGMMQKPGLNEVLKGQARAESVIFRDTKTGAALIGVGKLDDVNVMSRSLEDWQKILADLGNGFDVVLLDSPPIVSFPESKLLAKLSQNILCVRWKKTSVKLLEFALDTLDRLGCPVLGTVITMSGSKQDFVQDSYRS